MAGSRPDIDTALASMTTRAGTNLKRSAALLPSLLREGESVQVIVWAMAGAGYGILVLTNQRLLFVVESKTEHHVLGYEFHQISSVEWTSKLMGGRLVLHVVGNRSEEFKVPDNGTGAELAQEIRERAAQSTAAVPAPVQVAASSDRMEQLRQLGALHDAGIISPAEFEAKKTEILGRI